MSRYKLQTYQFGIVNGLRQDVSDRINSAMPNNLFAPEARKGHLFVLTDAVNEGARGKEACDLVTQTIIKTFYADTSFSITSGLRNALKAANTALYEFNFKAAHHQKTAVGCTCAVLRNNDLYIAQVQPTQAYVAHRGQLRALPTNPSWQGNVSSSTIMPPNALGTSLFSEPEMFRNVVEAGDMLVLCSSRLARVLGRADAERMFCLSEASASLEELYAIARRNSLNEAHVALIDMLPFVDPNSELLSAEGLAERGKAAASVVGEWISDVTANAALMVRREKDDENGEPSSAIDELPPMPAELEEVDPRDMGWLNERPRYRPRSLRDAEQWLPSAYLGETSMVAAIQAASSAPSIDLTDMEPLPVDFAAVPVPQRDPVVPLTGWQKFTAPFRYLLAAIVTYIANFGRNSRPMAPPLPRFAQARGGDLSYRRSRRRNIPWTLIALLIVLVGGGWFYVQDRRTQNTEAAYQDSLNVANSKFETAVKATDDRAALEELGELDTHLETLASDQGYMSNPTRKADYLALRKKSDNLRASIDRTSFLTDLKLVTTMPTSDTIGKLIVTPNTGKNDLYFIGTENGALYSYTEGSSGQPTSLLKDGDEIAGLPAAPIRSVMLREGELAAIDAPPNLNAQSNIYFYLRDTKTWVSRTIQGSELWTRQPFPDIETYGGGLYVYDLGRTDSATAGEILRYRSGEFANLPENWITDSTGDFNTKAVVDIAIDGRIYMLQPDGTVGIFEGGSLIDTVSVPALDPPLRARRLFVEQEVSAETFRDNQGHFFIVDAVNQRVIEVNRQGEIIQQLKVPSTSTIKLELLNDVAVVGSGSSKMLYLANSNRIYSMVLPSPPPPRESLGGTTTTPTVQITPTP
ncbi:hypothetical protein [Herpetosiphon llansteffanensis]|uniref:hypothetical protein n=1 Tax=Herpetosiphon llansteffanensis TaxID=2094568 RepID=UPI000D7C3698|nr:hypothetical protein [Herpetosiphon llansteffanensis]